MLSFNLVAGLREHLSLQEADCEPHGHLTAMSLIERVWVVIYMPHKYPTGPSLYIWPYLGRNHKMNLIHLGLPEEVLGIGNTTF